MKEKIMQENAEDLKVLSEAKLKANEIEGDIKTINEKLSKLSNELSMMSIGSPLKELKQEEIDKTEKELEAKKAEKDSIMNSINENSNTLKDKMKTSIEEEMSTYKRKAQIEKEKKEVEPYRIGIENLNKEIDKLTQEIQEISEEIKNGDVSRMERMNAAAALIKSDKDRISNMQKRINEVDNYKALEDHVDEFKKLEHMSMNLNNIIDKECEMIQKDTKTTEEKNNEDKTGKDESDTNSTSKGKSDYDWGDLTEDQIDELWSEGITPDAQEYGQAYTNFARAPHYEPKVHDDVETEPNPGSPEFQPPAVIVEREEMQPPAIVPDLEKNGKLEVIKEMFEDIWNLIKSIRKPFAKFGKFVANKVSKFREDSKIDMEPEEDFIDRKLRERAEKGEGLRTMPKKEQKEWTDGQEQLAEEVQSIMAEYENNPWEAVDHEDKINPLENLDPEVIEAIVEVGRNAGKHNENNKSEQEKDSSKSEQENDGQDEMTV